MHIRQATLDAVVVVRRLRVIQAQEVKDGRVEVVNGRHILDGPEAELVRGAIADTALDARSRQPRAVGLGVVAASFGGGIGYQRRAAELGRPTGPAAESYRSPDVYFRR